MDLRVHREVRKYLSIIKVTANSAEPVANAQTLKVVGEVGASSVAGLPGVLNPSMSMQHQYLHAGVVVVAGRGARTAAFCKRQ